MTESLKGQYEVRLLEEGVSFADAQADKEALLKKHADTVLNRANPWRKPNYKQMDRSQALKKEIESSLVTAKTIEKSDPVAALVLHQKSLQLAEDQLNLLLEGGLFGEVEREFAKRNRCGLMLKVLDRIILLLCKEMRFQEANLIATNLFERYPYARDMSGAEAIHKRISKGLAKGQ